MNSSQHIAEFQSVIDGLLAEELLTNDQKLRMLQKHEARILTMQFQGRCSDNETAEAWLCQICEAKRSLS